MDFKFPWGKTPKDKDKKKQASPEARPLPSVVDDRTRIQGENLPAVQQPAPNGQGKKKKKEKPKLKPLTVIGHMILNAFKGLFVIGCIGLIIGSIAAVQVVQYVVEATEEDDLDLDTFTQAQTSYFMALNPNNPNAEAEGDWIEYQVLVGDSNRIWVGLDQMPDNLINAFIAIEDREFGNHHGVNIRRTVMALVNEVIPFQSNSFGASTITQQLVKNLTGDDVVDEAGDRTAGYQRKLREIFRAWGLHNRYSDDMILEAYLNTLGLSERLAGVEAGAQSYFNKTVSELTLAECAVIAGITRAPTYYSPYQNPENCLLRRDDVIAQMKDLGFITPEEAQAVYDVRDLGLADRSARRTQSSSSATSAGVFTYFSDKVYEDVIQDLMSQKGWTRTQARWYLYNGGYRVYLTVDINIQNQLDEIIGNGYDPETGFFMDQERFADYEQRMTITEEILNSNNQVVGYQEVKPQMAAVVIDYNGQLKGTIGGIGEKESSLSLNRSIGTVTYTEDGTPVVQGTLRQPGSSMKPIAAYALGIDYGIITYSKTVMDAPILSRNPYNPARNPETGEVVKDWPYNYGGAGNVRNEKIPVYSAIAESTNTVAAQVGQWVQREPMFEFLRDTLEISSLVEPQDVDLAPLVLGSSYFGMSCYEMAGAYMMFGGNDSYGIHRTLHCYTRVEDTRGNIVVEPEIITVQAIDPQSGYIMNKMLQNVLKTGSYPAGGRPASPTAGGMAPEGDMPAAGKTGTTNEDNDRWFVGLTPYYVTAVWWGYDRDHTLLAQGGKGWPAGGRRNPPIIVWKALMEALQEDLEVKEFPDQPEGIQEISFCTISGERAIAGCPTSVGYFADFRLPENCPGHGPPPEDIPVV